ncbi:MAG: hypothetical protein LBB15_00830 [Puniceicoccales bacterium]|jgi:hypothetical protein|nr:hypothetical protein [Puniceicoccales bacterium]
MTKNTSKFNSSCPFLCTAILGLVLFCLSLALVRSRQHIMGRGYSIGNLEHICFSYEQKIAELDRAILAMGARSKIIERAEKGVWKPGSVAVHITRNDIQRYVLASGKHTDAVIAKNFSRAN